jgi:hypothetical protein
LEYVELDACQEVEQQWVASSHRARPSAVERTHSWLSRLLKLLASVAKSEANCTTLLSLASALIY